MLLFLTVANQRTTRPSTHDKQTNKHANRTQCIKEQASFQGIQQTHNRNKNLNLHKIPGHVRLRLPFVHVGEKRAKFPLATSFNHIKRGQMSGLMQTNASQIQSVILSGEEMYVIDCHRTFIRSCVCSNASPMLKALLQPQDLRSCMPPIPKCRPQAALISLIRLR